MSKEKVKLNNAELVLGPSLLAMIKINPLEPQLRAQVMARCVMAIPDNVKTYDEIVEWVECDVKIGPKDEIYDPFTLDGPQPLPPPPPRPPFNGVEVNLDVSQVGHGSCHYTCNETGREVIQIPRSDIQRMAEYSDNLSQFIDKLHDYIADNAGQDPDWSDCSDYEYDDHESLEHTDFDYSYNHDRAENKALEILSLAFPEEHDRLINS